MWGVLILQSIILTLIFTELTNMQEILSQEIVRLNGKRYIKSVVQETREEYSEVTAEDMEEMFAPKEITPELEALGTQWEEKTGKKIKNKK